jgi:predicted nuclease with TOPRIM domain
MEELKAYIKELIAEITNVAVMTSKVNEHDLKLTNHNNRIMFLELSDARREERDKTILEKLNKIQTVTEELASKPTKKWDLISAIVISSVISGIIGFFISHLLK